MKTDLPSIFILNISLNMSRIFIHAVGRGMLSLRFRSMYRSMSDQCFISGAAYCETYFFPLRSISFSFSVSGSFLLRNAFIPEDCADFITVAVHVVGGGGGGGGDGIVGVVRSGGVVH